MNKPPSVAEFQATQAAGLVRHRILSGTRCNVAAGYTMVVPFGFAVAGLLLLDGNLKVTKQ